MFTAASVACLRDVSARHAASAQQRAEDGSCSPFSWSVGADLACALDAALGDREDEGKGDGGDVLDHDALKKSSCDERQVALDQAIALSERLSKKADLREAWDLAAFACEKSPKPGK